MDIRQETIDEVARVGEAHREQQRLEAQHRAVAEAVLAVYRAGWRAGMRDAPEDEEAFAEHAARVFGKALLESGTSTDPDGLRRILGLV